MQTDADPLLTVKEVTQRVPVTMSTVRRWIREGKIEIVRFGPTKRVRIRLSELRRYFPQLRSQM